MVTPRLKRVTACQDRGGAGQLELRRHEYRGWPFSLRSPRWDEAADLLLAHEAGLCGYWLHRYLTRKTSRLSRELILG